MTDEEAKHRAFHCNFLGDALRPLADLSREQKLRVVAAALDDLDNLCDANFLHRNGLTYFRQGYDEDRVQAVLKSGFIPEGTKLEPGEPPPAKSGKKQATGFVYLMRNKRNSYIKIGFSKDPKHREATLQSEEPEVELIKAWPGTVQDEAELHEHYALCRVRGEWFRLTPADIASILQQ